MHDLLGNAGMVRGWVSLTWTMLLLLALMTMSVSIAAVVDLLAERPRAPRLAAVPRNR